MVKKYLATRGLGAVLKKAKPSYPKAKPRGTPTKAGLTARRGALRGETLAQKYKKALGPTPKGEKAPKKKPIIGKFEKGIGTGVALTYAYLKLKESGKTKKDAKAKEDKKLKEATEKHKEEDEKRKKAYGKRAPKKSINYGGK